MPRESRSPVAMLVLTVFAGCGGDRAMSSDPAATGRTRPALIPMTEADIRRSAIACLQSPPYPIDGGPTCLRPDGTWIAYSGWGNTVGRYRIDGNRVVMDARRVPPEPAETIALFRDRAGRMVLRYEEAGSDRRLYPFAPYAEAEYFRALDRSDHRADR